MTITGLMGQRKQEESNFGTQGKETMPSSNPVCVGLCFSVQCFWNMYFCHCLLQVKMSLPVFLGGRVFISAFSEQRGLCGLKLCESIGFCKSRSVCCLFIEERCFCFKSCYLPNAILLLACHVFATLVFLCEV